jgi:Na+-translocating ferredoxin:NAD+ oxidoreductase RNF subunit RnfB
MTSVQHTLYVRFDEGRCTGCAACLRACPTKAIRIRDHKSIRIVDQCIGCGACLRICPAGAVSAAADVRPEDIGRGHTAIALVSPVLYAQFPGVMPGGVLLGLRRLGFAHTVDMSFFLEMFQYAAEAFIERNRVEPTAPWPLISPICPVVVRLIAFQFPSLLPHLLPVLRPVALMAREVKRRIVPLHGPHAPTVLYYLNPCATKAVTPDRGREPAETAIGINSVFIALKRHVDQILGSDVLPFAAGGFEFESCSSGNAALVAMSGGEIANMDVDRSLSVHGLEETVAYLHQIEMGRLKDIEYIEFRTCREGCLGGVLTAVDKYLARRNVQKMIDEFGLGRRLPRKTVLRLYARGEFQPERDSSTLTRLFGGRKSPLSLEEAQRVEATLTAIAGRDCGACGAPDCLSFAEDVVRDRARMSECMWVHARREAQKEKPS